MGKNNNSRASEDTNPIDFVPQEYVKCDPLKNDYPRVLKVPAKRLTFPLTEDDKHDIKILEQQFDNEDNCGGLAAPQIGIAKAIIIFGLEESEELKKWRPDFTQAMDKQIWINPSYEPAGDELSEDYEACFSVAKLTGPVLRYKKIKYKAYNIYGKLLKGTAEGFLARLIQHEIDHIDGKLFIDNVPEEKRMNIEDYRALRAKSMESGRSESSP